MSWGYRITILSLGFVLFISFLVASAFRQRFDLVTEDYYGKELKFQSHIQKQENQQTLEGKIQVVQTKEQISIHFPASIDPNSAQGEILFFCPSDERKDYVSKMKLSESNEQSVSKSKLKKGFYRLQIDYSVNGKECFFEETLMID